MDEKGSGSMDSHLYPYREIVKLLQQWERGLEQENAPELSQLCQYEVKTLCEAISAILMIAETDLRLTALDALPYIVPREMMTDLLVGCLSDPRSSVRWTACKLFQHYPDPQIIPNLIYLLGQDDNPTVRFMAADLLCEFGDESALPALANAVDNDPGKDYEGRAVADAAREAIASIQERMKAAK
jgi:HEAT repeat protein